ncbi:MAG: DUF5716 family protein [Bacilli bacterium]|nr:DUF5716 family protein [Bacilli bacterium]
MKDLNTAATLFNGILRPNFFGLLSSANKNGNFIMLWVIDDLYGDKLDANGIDREIIVNAVDDHLKRYKNLEIDDEETQAALEGETITQIKSTKDKARSFIRDLVDKGWLDEEILPDYTVTESRSDGFNAVFGALKNLVLEDIAMNEYSTPIIQIYNSLQNLDPQNRVQTIEMISSSRRQITKDLNSINSKIKRFINRALSNPKQSEKEMLEELLTRYVTLPAYRSFLNLIGENNVLKFVGQINIKIRKLWEEDREPYIRDLVKVKGYDISTPEAMNASFARAEKEIGDVLFGTIALFNDLSLTLRDLSKRNERYVTVSRAKLNFGINNAHDLSKDINNLLKMIKAKDKNGTFSYTDHFPITMTRYLSEDSIYSPRTYRGRLPSQVETNIREKNVDSVSRFELLAEKRGKYTKEQIIAFVEKSLAGRKEMLASQIQVENEDDAIKLVMIPVFSTKEHIPYRVQKLRGQTFEQGEYLIDEFKIVKRGKER